LDFRIDFKFYFVSSNQVFGQAAVLIELRVEHDEVDPTEPEGEVVVTERRNIAGDRFRSGSVS
jgi:hypothetical protein